jgi:hypothetical protein
LGIDDGVLRGVSPDKVGVHENLPTIHKIGFNALENNALEKVPE